MEKQQHATYQKRCQSAIKFSKLRATKVPEAVLFRGGVINRSAIKSTEDNIIK